MKYLLSILFSILNFIAVSQGFLGSYSYKNPQMTVGDAYDITCSGAKIDYSYVSNGGANINRVSIVWSNSNSDPTILDEEILLYSYIENIVSFANSYIDQTFPSGYIVYYRGFIESKVTNSSGNLYSYTDVKSVFIPTTPTVITVENASGISDNYIDIGGSISDDGGGTITDYGVCWNTSGNPTLSDNYDTPYVGDESAFVVRCQTLLSGTTYYFRAYAVNECGTVYGEQRSFTTTSGVSLPTVTTTTISSISFNTATGGGNVTDAGGGTISGRGIVWNTTGAPTLSSYIGKTNNGTGVGSFTSYLTSLDCGETYHVRAYATNEAGTAYGQQVTFTTRCDLDIISLNFTDKTNTSITVTTYVDNYCPTNSITLRYIYYNTSGSYSDHSNKVFQSSSEGSESTVITMPSGTYYFGTYAETNCESTYEFFDSPFTFTSASLPSVSTASITNISYATATGGGNVTSDGGATVTARGVCWNTTGTPTISNSKTTDGSGTGSFTSSLTGLSDDQTYYVRAYATNSAGTSYGSQVSFKTNTISIPIVTTTDISSITYNSAVSGGNVTSQEGSTVTERGIVYGTVTKPDIFDNKVTDSSGGLGSYTSNITGLSPSTTYYVRAYAINSAGVAYGDEYSFTTPSTTIPIVTTTDISSITYNSAVSGGNVKSQGGATVTARGVCWNTTGTPTISNRKTTDGSGIGSFTSSLTGLSDDQTYYVRAYATNSAGTSYGSQVSFKTNTISIPSVTTTTASSITTNSASSGGNVTSDGGGTVSARGVVWNRVGNPTVNSYMGKTTDGSGTGSFTSYLTSLSCGYLYYVRAYAINEVGTAYGTQRSFTTPCGLDVTGLSVNATNNPVTATSTVVNGCPTNSIVTRYIYYNTTGVSSDHTYKVYQSNYTGMISTDILMSAGTYYFGAYSETDCGSDYYFWTSPVTIYDVELPTVSTASITDISYTTATGGGYVSDDGGGTVTARGVCWNTTGTPTISNSKTTDGSGTGSFTSSLTGLSDDQTYYVRAYATNSAGTSYGSQVSFTTNSSYIPCDSPKSYPGGISYPTKLYFTLGSSIGTVSFTYNPYSYPDQMIVEIDGVIVLDTGYRGSTTYDYGGLNRSYFTTSLNGKSDPTGGVYPNLTKYTDDGYPRVTYNYNYTTDYFNKVTTYPTAIVKVYAPMPGTAWEFTLGCPQ